MGFVNKLERKFGKYAIHNLMFYIIALYIVGLFIQLFGGGFYEAFLSLNVEMILKGQIWRIVTFIIAPPTDTSLFFMVFTLYLYYVLGTALENVWGAFRFNLYFIMGILFNVIAAFLVYFIFGYSFELTTYYLNLSLFFAFAATYPDMEFLLFFILPVKVKWLAMIDAVYMGATIIFGYTFSYFPYKVQLNLFHGLLQLGILPFPEVATAALVSILNFIIFFLMTRNYKRISPKEIKRKKSYRRQVKSANSGSRHKCVICGRTSEEYPELTFRYCSKCNGNYEYCQDHLFTHEHVK
ncbi:MAG: hypothetical protein K2M60_07535 [Lachnospiraceae bacterium]|nr:hypothetical protein [Lachnospiraceae bacterium]MDE6253916.1 hypothetical protein [Lachnospiraceae bacterium]